MGRRHTPKLHTKPSSSLAKVFFERRRRARDAPSRGRKAEIFLYDTLPGGAGFSTLLVERGVELCERALQLLKTCPENCDASCYRCLRSFKNKFEHILLDRHVGAELLEYLLNGQLPQFDAERLKKSTGWLSHDLRRQGGDTKYEDSVSVSVGRGAEITPNGESVLEFMEAQLQRGHEIYAVARCQRPENTFHAEEVVGTVRRLRAVAGVFEPRQGRQDRRPG